jgi:hypothetical protein
VRQPSILDVVRAVTEVSPSHPEIRTWWYAPPKRLRLRGELEADGSRTQQIVEVAVDAVSPSADFDALASELSRKLRGSPVTVRTFRGADEERQLYRLLSREPVRVTGATATQGKYIVPRPTGET